MNVFVRIVTNIVYVQFAILIGFLIFLCFRTGSKGLIWVTVAKVLMTGKVIGYIIGRIHSIFLFIFNIEIIEQWEPSLDVRGESLFQVLEFYIIVSGIEIIIGYSFCLLGAFLIYKEWRQGKFHKGI